MSSLAASEDELPLLVEGNARCARLRSGEIVPIQTFFRSFAQVEDTSTYKWATRSSNASNSSSSSTAAGVEANPHALGTGATGELSKSTSSLSPEDKASEYSRFYTNENPDNLVNDNESSIVVFIIDKRNDHAIEKARRLCSAVIRGLPLPYVVISHAQIILRTSSNITSFLGYRTAELVGQHISIIAPREELLCGAPWSTTPRERNSLSEMFTMDLSLTEEMYGAVSQTQPPTSTTSTSAYTSTSR